MKRARDDIDRLLTLLDTAAESALRAPKEELDAEPQSDDKPSAGKAGQIIRDRLKAFSKQRLEAAKRGAQLSRERRHDALDRLPADPTLRRALLESVIATQSRSIPEQFTQAFRDGTEITDAEVESILAALIRLGVIDEGGSVE